MKQANPQGTAALHRPKAHLPVRLPVRWPILLAWVLGGIVAGLGATWWQIRHYDNFGLPSGPWRVNLLAGSTEADPLTRARVAVGGLLALNRSETMYFIATQDSSGAPLRAQCAYQISGVPPQAAWWSITAYADDFFLFPNAQRRYSINSATAALGTDGHFSVRTDPREAPEVDPARIPTPGQGGLVLTLRLYRPSATLQASPTSLNPPRIERTSPCA